MYEHAHTQDIKFVSRLLQMSTRQTKPTLLLNAQILNLVRIWLRFDMPVLFSSSRLYNLRKKTSAKSFYWQRWYKELWLHKMATVFAVTLATNHPEGNVLHLRLQLTFLFLASHHPGYIFKRGIIVNLWCSHYWYVDHSYPTALIKSDKSCSD